MSPEEPSDLVSRARAHYELGRLAEARADLEAALAAQPDMFAALMLLAGVLTRQADSAGAERCYRRAIELRPGHGPALNNLGNVLKSAGRLEEALEQYAIAVRHDPRFAEAHANWGAALREAGRIDEAVPLLERAIALKPDSVRALNNLGISYFMRQRFGDAIECYRRALLARPDFLEALTNKGNALAALARSDEAAECYAEVIARRPGDADAHNNLGMLQHDRGDPEAALASYQRALALDPRQADALSNLGSLLVELGRREEAMGFFRRALEVNPRLARASYNLGVAHLYRFEFARGWELLESRYDIVPPVTPRRALPMPQFGAPDWGKGHRIAIWREQGVGDQLIYATLLPDLEARNQDFVIEVDRRLVAPFARAHPRWTVVAREDSAGAFANCDRHLALGSLPGLLRPDIESFARQPSALLAPDPARAAGIRQALAADSRVFGISWRSFQPRARDRLGRNKSASLSAFRALSRKPGTRLLDLQYGDTAAEREEFARSGGRLERVEGLDLFEDLDGLLAAIEACDLVITTSNVTAHLAGTIGKRTLLIYLKAAPPFHYWVPGPDGKCLWYPSVEVVTGPDMDTWDKALGRVDELLGP